MRLGAEVLEWGFVLYSAVDCSLAGTEGTRSFLRLETRQSGIDSLHVMGTCSVDFEKFRGLALWLGSNRHHIAVGVSIRDGHHHEVGVINKMEFSLLNTMLA